MSEALKTLISKYEVASKDYQTQLTNAIKHGTAQWSFHNIFTVYKKCIWANGWTACSVQMPVIKCEHPVVSV